MGIKRASMGILLGMTALAFAFASGSAAADKCSDVDVDDDTTPLTRALQKEHPECYKEIKDKMNEADTLAKFRRNAGFHAWFGELKINAYASLTNEFALENTTAFIDTTGDQLKNFYVFEGGWVDKKLVRDAYAAGSPDHYLGLNSNLRAWLVDAWTLTLTGGYKHALAEDATLADPTFENRGVFTVKGGYSVSFDKALSWDID